MFSKNKVNIFKLGNNHSELKQQGVRPLFLITDVLKHRMSLCKRGMLCKKNLIAS